MRFLLSLFFILLMIVGYFPVSILWRETKVLDNKIQLPGKFIKASDGPIYTQQVGFPEQPVVVYLPGRLAWSENWKPTMSFLAQHGYRGVALDIPPWGLSPEPVSKDYGRVAQSLRIKSAIDNLRIKDFILVGHAEGAQIALTLASILENRVRGMVLLSPDVGLSKIQGQRSPPKPAWLQATMRNPVAREFAAAMVTHPWFTKSLLKDSLYNNVHLTRGVLKVYQYPFNFKGTNNKVANWLLEYVYGKDGMLATDTTFYEKVRSPTLIIWGEQDQVTPTWQVDTLRGLLPQAEVVMVRNTGHLPQIEDSVMVNEALLKFVGKILTPVKL